VRLLEIEDFDLSGCGGTHVHSTAEIGAIKVLSAERHRGGTTRVTFLCGHRAFDDYCRKHNVVSELAQSHTTGEEDLLAAIRTMETTHAESRKREKQLLQALIDRETSVLLSTARSAGQSRVVRAAYSESPWDAESVRAVATRIAETPSAIALLGWSGEKTQLTFVRGSEAHGHMGALMKMACENLGGRGGGRPDWAQGGCSGSVTLEMVLDQVYDMLVAEKS
jgi:alanyl-tRNA synthetase